MNDTIDRQSAYIALALALLMAATRSDHFATAFHLPDASGAVFFLAGFYLRPASMFAALIALAGLNDYVAIAWLGVNDFCVSPAYGFLLPAYGMLWLAGRWYAGRYRFALYTLIPLTGSLLIGAVLCEIVSGGGFYFFSGRFAETNFAEFGLRFLRYFPAVLESLALWIGFASVAHSAFVLAAKRSIQSRSAGEAGSIEPGKR
ncbi:MAG: hypothetical protein ACRERU_09645 [Methylococcales bacterium]